MRKSPCLVVSASRKARLEFLLRDYAYLGDDIPRLQHQIDCLQGLQSNETLARWKALAADRALPQLYAELMDLHYDPLYQRSQNHNYAGFAQAPVLETGDLSPAGLADLAERALQVVGADTPTPA